MEIKVLRYTTLLVFLVIILFAADSLINISRPVIINNSFALGYIDDTSWSLVISSVLLVLVGLWWHWHNYTSMPVVFILAGGLVNIFERIVFGGVIDYFKIFNIYFNISDIFIVLGFIVFILIEILKYTNKKPA